MMKQPELGKKIIALRKQMGLTQEELVLKCNLNVRTLQRIESGEVNPRSHTVKTIFEALEYDESLPEFKRYEKVKHYLESNFKKYYKQIITEENMSKLKTFFLRFFLATGLVYFIYALILINQNYRYNSVLDHGNDRLRILLSIAFPLAYAIVRTFEKNPKPVREAKRFINVAFHYFLSLGIVWVLVVFIIFAFEETLRLEEVQWTLVLPLLYAITTVFRRKIKPKVNV